MQEFPTGYQNSYQARDLGMVEPELANMARGAMSPMAPMSASTPMAIPMRNYAKGGAVKKADKKGTLSVTIVSMAPRSKMGRVDDDERMERMERAKRRHEREMAYDDRIMGDTEREMKKKGGSAKCYAHGGRVGSCDHPRRINEEMERGDEAHMMMRKGGKMERLAAAVGRRKHDIGYDDKIIKEARGAYKGGDRMKPSMDRMAQVEHEKRMRRLERAKLANEYGKKEDEAAMRKGGRVNDLKSMSDFKKKVGHLKKAERDLRKDMKNDKEVMKDFQELSKRKKFAAGGAAKVRKGMMTPEGKIKDVVKKGQFV